MSETEPDVPTIPKAFASAICRSGSVCRCDDTLTYKIPRTSYSGFNFTVHFVELQFEDALEDFDGSCNGFGNITRYIVKNIRRDRKSVGASISLLKESKKV